MTPPRILVYVLRRDIRLGDNPILHEAAKVYAQSQAPFTHMLPLYIFTPSQLEVSGFLSPSPYSPSTTDGAAPRCPYPEARSQVGGFWRCGRHRAQFLAESVFDLKHSLEEKGSGLSIRVGTIGDVVRQVLDAYGPSPGTNRPEGKSGSENASESHKGEVVGVWMTADETTYEKREERDVRELTLQRGKEFRLFRDEKYLIDDRDVPLKDIDDLPDVFTTYRNKVEPLRDAPRKTLAVSDSLPPLPPQIIPQAKPFVIPSTLPDTLAALLAPLEAKPDFPVRPLDSSSKPTWPSDAESAHPFKGGETAASERLNHLISSGSMSRYKDTRNGLFGLDFSTKLSAWLAYGCITSREIHARLCDFEDGRGEVGKSQPQYGHGENKSTYWVRFELLWRDYMRLCARKHGSKLFHLGGFFGGKRNASDTPNDDYAKGSKSAWRSVSGKSKQAEESREILERWITGRTGIGLIDASMRELFLTGWTSNRVRQNAGSFLSRYLQLDWRLGAEWYESCLVDYDVASNWGNWQSVALTSRAFNPVKQAFDYDSKGEYVKMWVPELRGVGETAVDGLFQPWKLSKEDKEKLMLQDNEIAARPLARIEYRPSKGGRGGGGKKGGRGGYSGRGGNKKGRGQKRMGQQDRAQI